MDFDGKRYSNHVLPTHTHSILQHPRAVLQSHNTQPHMARLTHLFLQRNNNLFQSQSSKSLDLIQIKQHWTKWIDMICQRQLHPQTLQQLTKVLHLEWESIPIQFLLHTFASIRCRLWLSFVSAGGIPDIDL